MFIPGGSAGGWVCQMNVNNGMAEGGAPSAWDRNVPSLRGEGPGERSLEAVLPLSCACGTSLGSC